MAKLPLATSEQMEQIRRAAVNEVTREIARTGVRLNWYQADELGDQALDWMVARLGLERSTDIEGVNFFPPEAGLGLKQKGNP